ncbi:MAG: 16S rRNA (cytosine(1402)-N(4))-methyltransferase, partial [Candidatus Omnitrophica bacterium]|nr:16S rRNA (cytosine(1402)-N(4))-methyltransferase [Candidatus Omnitrophota bacterium]
EAAGRMIGSPVHKKPIVAAEAEIQRNPRSRSAKLRIFERGKPAKTGGRNRWPAS